MLEHQQKHSLTSTNTVEKGKGVIGIVYSEQNQFNINGVKNANLEIECRKEQENICWSGSNLRLI